MPNVPLGQLRLYNNKFEIPRPDYHLFYRPYCPSASRGTRKPLPSINSTMRVCVCINVCAQLRLGPARDNGNPMGPGARVTNGYRLGRPHRPGAKIIKSPSRSLIEHTKAR